MGLGKPGFCDLANPTRITNPRGADRPFKGLANSNVLPRYISGLPDCGVDRCELRGERPPPVSRSATASTGWRKSAAGPDYPDGIAGEEDLEHPTR